MHTVRVVLYKDIVTGATSSAARVLKYPPVVNWKDTGGEIPVDINTAVILPTTTTQFWTDTGTSFPPIRIGSQKSGGPRRSIIHQEVRNADPLGASVNINPAKYRVSNPRWIIVIGSKTFTNGSANIYACSRMNFGSDTILSKSPDFMVFGLSSIKTTDEIRSVFVPTARIVRPTDGSNWLPPGHDISEATEDRVRGTKARNHYNFKSEFETRRDKMVDQYFGRQNDPMS